MKLWLYFAAALTAYLVAGWNPAITFSKLIYHQDIRTCGSKNPGFTNFKRCFGNRWAWFVLALDLLKAALVVLLFAGLFGWQLDCRQLGAAYTGLFAVLGHAYPVWYRFRGGKGFASYLGMTLALNWKFALLVMVLVALVTLISDYIVVGTVTTVLLVPAYMAFTHGLYFSAILCIATAAILIKHRENYVRIYRGTEISLRKANRGEHRKV